MSEYQWKDVSVVGFDELMQALERADRKGYMPDAIKEEWEAFNWKPAQPEPVAWADECRIELVNAIHFLASDFENALGAFGGDTEARRKAEGDIAHARSIASRWNWNGTSPPAQQQEPFIYYRHYDGGTQDYPDEKTIPLYTSPLAQRKPLTDEQIVAKALHLSGLGTSPDVIQFARAIEAAHGIKENT